MTFAGRVTSDWWWCPASETCVVVCAGFVGARLHLMDAAIERDPDGATYHANFSEMIGLEVCAALAVSSVPRDRGCRHVPNALREEQCLRAIQ